MAKYIPHYSSIGGPLSLCYLLKVYVVQQEKGEYEMGGGARKTKLHLYMHETVREQNK